MQQEPNISELCRIIQQSVGSAVQNALHSPEVAEIKQTVKDVAKEVTDDLTGSVRQAADDLAGSVRQSVKPRVRVYDTPPPPQADAVVAMVQKKTLRQMSVQGGLMTGFGISGAILGLALAAVVAVAAFIFAGSFAASLAFGLFSLIPLGGCVAFALLASRGLAQSGMAARYRRYVATIGDDKFCPVKLLAEAVGKKTKFAVKDIQRMINAGLFPQGQLDGQKSCLILDMDTYRQYLMAEEKMKQCRQEQQTPEPATAPKSDIEAALADGREYIRRMRLANDLIAGEVISGKLDRIESVCRRIFDLVEQQPEKLPDIRRFMSYYLPITLKLLEGYCKFDNQPVQGDNITAAKKEIEDTLDTVIMAFENLLDGLFQQEAMDLSSDISALEAMLAQEGLTGSDFKKP